MLNKNFWDSPTQWYAYYTALSKFFSLIYEDRYVIKIDFVGLTQASAIQDRRGKLFEMYVVVH
jgi:hypothetical protein